MQGQREGGDGRSRGGDEQTADSEVLAMHACLSQGGYCCEETPWP